MTPFDRWCEEPLSQAEKDEHAAMVEKRKITPYYLYGKDAYYYFMRLAVPRKQWCF